MIYHRLLFAFLIFSWATSAPAAEMKSESARAVPHFQVDPFWPKPLPNDWILGQVAGIAVDRHDHVWIVQRPRSLTPPEMAAAQNPPLAECCRPAPSVIEFDPAGNLINAWGGPSWDQAAGKWVEPAEGWPESEHGIFIDALDNVWIAGNGENDHVVLKMTRMGRRLLTVGKWHDNTDSNDPARLGRPADMYVEEKTSEVYIADGYGNRRIIVFDSNTGEYKRHWGAYGNRPHDRLLPDYDPQAKEPLSSFRNPVHGIVLSNDGHVYLADRTSNRLQIFSPEGTYVNEMTISPRTLGPGSVWDLALSPDAAQHWLFVADGSNHKIWIVERSTLSIRDSFGRGGRQAGQFDWVHNVATDSKGNVYTAEVRTGNRIQKFSPVSD
jgi:DNA-binding beta-propeller fold protein YncE